MIQIFALLFLESSSTAICNALLALEKDKENHVSYSVTDFIEFILNSVSLSELRFLTEKYLHKTKKALIKKWSRRNKKRI